MPVQSKAKGKRFELALSKMFQEHGFETRRSAQYAGNTGEAADVIGAPHIHIEAKAQETLRLKDWMEQAKHDAAKSGRLPIVFHKKSREPVLVTMEFDSFMELYKGYEKSRGAE